MALLNFPQNPNTNDTWTIGTRTWVWNGSAWQIVSGIKNLNPFTADSIAVTTSTNSTSTTSGALTVAGGVGIGGNLWVGGDIVANKLTIEYTTVTTTLVVTDDIIQTTNITEANNTYSGALQIAGGAGIGGNAYIGGNLKVYGAINIGSSIYTDFAKDSISANDTVLLDAWGADFYRTVKYLVQVVDTGFTPNLIHSAELMLAHDNNGAATYCYLVQYGVVVNFGELGSWDTAYQSGVVSLTFTPNYVPTNMTIKVNRLGITT